MPDNITNQPAWDNFERMLFDALKREQLERDIAERRRMSPELKAYDQRLRALDKQRVAEGKTSWFAPKPTPEPAPREEPDYLGEFASNQRMLALKYWVEHGHLTEFPGRATHKNLTCDRQANVGEVEPTEVTTTPHED